MKVKLLLIAILLTAGFSTLVQAQSPFAGSYDLLAGVSTGNSAGLFCYGTATFRTNGRASYTVYWPYLGTSGSGSGSINSRGVFAFTDGTLGSAQFYANRVAVGTFSQRYGRGFFAMRKR